MKYFHVPSEDFTYIYIVLYHVSCLVIGSRHIEHEDFSYEKIFRHQKLKPFPSTMHFLLHSENDLIIQISLISVVQNID